MPEPDLSTRARHQRRDHPKLRRPIIVGAVACALLGAAGAVGVGVAASPSNSADAAPDPARPTPTSGESIRPASAESDGAGSTTAPPLSEIAGLGEVSSAVIDQLEYMHANWQSTQSEQFGFLPENDCVNFASQSLLARGWAVDDEWYFDESGDHWSHGPAWISSTAFREYLLERSDLATELTDAERDQVQIGDIVQFDWDRSGDRDHTGIVTAVDRDASGTVRISYAGHTDATWDRSVDWAITDLHPGADVYYWSIAD